jgi:hypothetical protein
MAVYLINGYFKKNLITAFTIYVCHEYLSQEEVLVIYLWRYQMRQCEQCVSAKMFINYSLSRKIGKPNNLNVLGINKTKGPKQDSKKSAENNIALQVKKCLFLSMLFQLDVSCDIMIWEQVLKKWLMK